MLRVGRATATRLRTSKVAPGEGTARSRLNIGTRARQDGPFSNSVTEPAEAVAAASHPPSLPHREALSSRRQVEINKNLPVGGRLAHFKVEWQSLTDSQFVLQAVSGLALELVDRPPLTTKPACFDCNRGISQEKANALRIEIDKLVSKNAIERVPSGRGFYARLFLVPKKDGSRRPVFNLKTLNNFVKKKTFKMATIHTVAQSIRCGDWAVSLDLKDAYLHIPILTSHRRFLRFVFKGEVYQFKVLPFGLCSAPRTFTKVTRVVVIHCRRLGLRLVVYLDDSLLLARPRRVAFKHRDILMGLLERLGFIINLQKSDLEPKQQWDFLGLHWDSANMAVTLPTDKLTTLQNMAADMAASSKPPTCRKLMKFLGKASFAAVAVPHARLYSRGLQMALREVYRGPRDLFKHCPLDRLAHSCLKWWSSVQQNGKSLNPPPPDLTITTDASRIGWGAAWGAKQLSGTWCQQEATLHINMLELIAVEKAVKLWAPKLRGRVVNLQVMTYIWAEVYIYIYIYI